MILFHFTPIFFFFNDTATTEIYTLSLHDALPICTMQTSADSARLHQGCKMRKNASKLFPGTDPSRFHPCWRDRKSTRLNSSHQIISYAVFCLKKKKKTLAYSIHT